jgi:hypothetical protein
MLQLLRSICMPSRVGADQKVARKVAVSTKVRSPAACLTNAVDTNANAVLNPNNAFGLARDGDPVDLDDNGLPDDNAFISVFNNEDAFLTDDLRYYFTADLRGRAGTAIGQTFMTLTIPELAEALAFVGAALLRLRSRLIR